MKKIIIGALATIAIAATALIAVPAMAQDTPLQTRTQDQTQVSTREQATIQTQITVQEQANIDSGLYAGYGAAFCGGGLVMNDTATLERVAATLGISYDQLVQRLQDGETIATIATAQKVDLSKVVDAVIAAQTDMVNLMVKYGYVTQDQANTILAEIRVRVKAALSVTTAAAGYGYGCYGITDTTSAPASGYGVMGGFSSSIGYGYGMMGGRVSHGCGW
jgi:hypothetical protein